MTGMLNQAPVFEMPDSSFFNQLLSTPAIGYSRESQEQYQELTRLI